MVALVMLGWLRVVRSVVESVGCGGGVGGWVGRVGVVVLVGLRLAAGAGCGLGLGAAAGVVAPLLLGGSVLLGFGH